MVRKQVARRNAVDTFAPRMITGTLALIAVFTFAFSFSNVWALGVRLGAARWAAPLVAPAVDLSVVALLVALHHLTVHGVTPRRFRSARVLLAFSGVATLTLNAAEPIVVGAYGRAAFDAVGPLLLIGWSEVGPALLSQIYAARPPTPRSVKDDTHPQPGTPSVEEIGAAPAAATNGPGRPASASLPDGELLAAARELDAVHRREHGRPVSADTLRGALGVGSAKARELMAAVRAGSTS